MLTTLGLFSIVFAMAMTFPTRAEKTGFQETSRYEETLEYCRQLAKQSPWLRLSSFGTSPEGRDLILLIASKDRAFDPASARKTGKPVVLIQAGIHAGEIDGKDAGLMLLRDIAVTKQRAALLDNAIILFMPIYNVDGHERFTPYGRINQNGPKEMGWRVTSRNLNLNRDYMKADAAETRAWLKLFTTWWPELTIDCHVTDGADYRYDVTYGFDAGPNVHRRVADWIRATVEDRLVPALEEDGHLASQYIFLRDDTDPAAGLANLGASTPRFSTGYTVVQNRPSFLLETHMLKDYRSRVIATYDTLKLLLEEVNRDPAALRDAVREADAEAARPGRVALVMRPANNPGKAIFQGVEYRREESDISGGTRIIYGTKPLDIQVEKAEGIDVTLWADKPIAYIVPPQWTEVIDVLKAHGLKLLRLKAPATASFDSYRMTDPNWQSSPFEGRHPVAFETERVRNQQRTYPAGSVLVPLDQRSAAVAVNLLEPEGPDSFVSWGFFDAIFEQKEYAEAYVMEELAREMLEKDPALRVELEKALIDPEFAASPRRRLDFFFRRSPYWDDTIGLYPVGLITIPWDFPVEPLE